MNATQTAFLHRLLETHSPSGSELAIQRIVADYVRPYADEVFLDPLGNLHAVLNPEAETRVLVDAHCDEIGLLVEFIDPEGFLSFAPVGGINRQLLPGERVVLAGPGGEVHGVIGRKPIHMMSEKERSAGVGEITDLWIDIGASSKEEAMGAAPPGTFAVVDSGVRPLLGDKLSARALDDRCGVFVIMEALRRLKGKKPKTALHFVSSTQEEVGCLGGKVAAFGVDPHLGFSVDVTHSSDFPGANPKATGEVRLGKGPALGVGPNYDPALVAHVRGVAERKRIPYQLQPRARGAGNNGFVIRHTRAGVPVCHFGLPLRYMHSAVEVVDVNNLEACAALIAASLAALPAKPEFGFRL